MHRRQQRTSKRTIQVGPSEVRLPFNSGCDWAQHLTSALSQKLTFALASIEVLNAPKEYSKEAFCCGTDRLSAVPRGM